MEETSTDWLYRPYIPRGKITLCAAYPGSGKTYMLCFVAACVSTGRPFFGISMNNIPFEPVPPENVIYLTTEDGLGDTIKARMRVCGADMKKVFSVETGKASLTYDSPEIEKFMQEKRPALMIFDPFQSYIGSIDMNAPNQTREKLNHIAELAEKYNVAVVLICHFNKNQKGDAITRILGSTDIVGISRSYMAIGNVPDNEGDEEIKFMSHEKSSLAKRGKTILFQIDPAKGGIVYCGENALTMDDYTAIRNKGRNRSAPALEAAKNFIIQQMPEGKRPAKEIYKLAEAAGFSERTLRSAKEEIGVIVKRCGYPAQSIWYLPGHENDDNEIEEKEEAP
ncbi:MAG: AAA family ATPase [Lachnospiraceae bacterium]|nr:AAA family ATPase [Lachnospiraceae bacterium]